MGSGSSARMNGRLPKDDRARCRTRYGDLPETFPALRWYRAGYCRTGRSNTSLNVAGAHLSRYLLFVRRCLQFILILALGNASSRAASAQTPPVARGAARAMVVVHV